MRYAIGLLLALGLAAVIGLADLADDEPIQPERVMQCLKSPKVAGLEIIEQINPFYLRGDFDGDGKPDYALQVRSRRKDGNGVLVCTGRGSIFLLGSGIAGSRFSDMPHDNFLAPQWVVLTKEEVAALAPFESNAPHPVPVVKGEAIAMIWEDGICLIYWDGAKFRWAGSR